MDSLELGDFVFIKEQTLRRYAAICHHVAQKNTRPNCLVIEDPIRTGIYWAVPLTSKSLAKFKDRATRFPDRFRFYSFMGKETCFNISEMIPITKQDIRNIYRTGGKKVRIRKDDFRDIQTHVQKIIKSPKRLSLVSQIQAPVLLMEAEKTLSQAQENDSPPKKRIIGRHTPNDRTHSR